MPERMTYESGLRAATTVGAGTLVIGGALLAFPDRMGPALGLTGRREAQIVGALDLVLVPGLLVGTPRWPWLAARAALNSAMAGYALTRPRGGGRRAGRARALALALVVATVADGTAAAATRGRGPDGPAARAGHRLG